MENSKNTFVKHYIGKGKQIKGMDIIRVSISLEEAMQGVHKYQMKDYITFEVAKLQNPDEFGKTHTCYLNEKVKKSDDNTKKGE